MDIDIDLLEDMHLEESDFDKIEYSQPISVKFILISFFFYSILPFFSLILTLTDLGLIQDSIDFFSFYVFFSICYIFFFYLISIGNSSLKSLIFNYRLKKSLDYYKKVDISYNIKFDRFIYKPEDPQYLMSNLHYFLIVFLIEFIVLVQSIIFFNAIYPNPTEKNILIYSIVIIFISFGFLSSIIILGIVYWHRRANYLAESFYTLKTYLMGNDKDLVSVFACSSFNSFFKFLYENDILINFEESRIDNLIYTIKFFSPNNKVIGKNLDDSLLKISFLLKKKNWLKALKEIETIETSLEEATNKLGSEYLREEHKEDDHFVKKWIDLFKKESANTIIKRMVAYIILLIISILAGVFKIN